MKRFFTLFMVLCMFCCCAITAMAAPASLTETSDEMLAVSGEEDQATPYGWPGTGPAPQITKIEYVDRRIVNGNLIVELKVTGYGNDRGAAYFNGQAVSSTRGNYFINYGTTADGWYYTYDCGPKPETGSYLFETTFKSINSPYSTKYFSYYVPVP